MSRSKFKGPFFNPIYKQNKQSKIKVKTNTILPGYVSKIYHIYNGKKWISLKISENMIGYKFGEFILTRSIFKYKKK